MNIFRVAFLMERLAPNSLTGALDDFYLGNLTSVSGSVYLRKRIEC
jgi:endoglucanase